MTAAGKRYVIVTSDDFGLCADVNEASIDAATRGLVRSVEIMPLAPGFADGVARLRAAPEIDVGVHLMLTSEFRACPWSPLTSRARAPSLYDARGYCPQDVETVRAQARPEELFAELDAQIRAVEEAGVRATHLTQHMFALDELSESGEEAFQILERLAGPRRLAVRVTNPRAAAKLAACGVAVVSHVPTDTHDVSMAARPARYAEIIRGAPVGVSELLVHCAYDTAAFRAFTTFGPRRQQDYDLVTGPELARAVEESGVEIVSWKQASALLAPSPAPTTEISP